MGMIGSFRMVEILKKKSIFPFLRICYILEIDFTFLMRIFHKTTDISNMFKLANVSRNNFKDYEVFKAFKNT